MVGDGYASSVSVVSLAGVAVASAVVTFLAVRVGEARCPAGLRDRSREAEGKPRIGGLAILLGLLVAWVVDPAAGRILVPVAAAGLVGLHDDLTHSSPVARLLVLGGICVLAAALAGPLLFTPDPLLLVLLPLPLLCVVVGFDFIDGLDGLAPGLALVALLPAALIAPSPLGVAAVAAVAVYLATSNRPPARTLLGDAGSNALGLLVPLLVLDMGEDGALDLLALSSRAPGEPAAPSPLLLPALVAVPLLDLATTVIRRLRAGNLTASERGHMHHKLLALHGRQDLAVLELLGVATICAGAAVVGYLMPDRTVDAAVGCGIALGILLFRTRATRPAPPGSR